MAWYDTGTVSVTNGSTAVVGSGTDFISAKVQVGEAFYGPDGKIYEIAAIVSSTSLTLADNYLGTTQSGQTYKIVPTQSLVADLATNVSTLITDFANVRDLAGEGKFDDGTVAAPGITFNLDQDNGLYRIGANNWAMAVGGSKIVDLTSTGIDVTGTVTADGVGIGTASPATILDCRENSTGGSTQIRVYNTDNSNTTTQTAALFLSPDSRANGALIYAEKENADFSTSASRDVSLVFSPVLNNSQTEAMRIDSSGNLLVGTTDTAAFDGTRGILIGGDNSTLAFSTTGNNQMLIYSTTDGLQFYDSTNNAQRMLLDNSGNLLVGTTDTTPWDNSTATAADDGIFLGGGRLGLAKWGGVPLLVNRTDSDGEIAIFYKDGGAVGSIGTNTGILYIGSGEGADAYLGFGNDIIRPVTSAGASRDNAIDLGYVGMKFKDVHAGGRGFFNLYSSGINSGNIMVGEGVYVGAANGDNQIRSSSAGGGSATLYIGNAAIQVSSDQRLKTNIVDTEMNATEKLNQVRVVDFNWDDPSDTSFHNRNARGKWTGVLAQELVNVLPFAVNAPRNEEDLSIDAESDQKWLVDQAQMVPVLIKAIQELTARIAALEGAN